MNKQKNLNQDKDLKQLVLSRINGECIKPKSKLMCLCNDYFVWVLWVMTVIVGAMAFTETIYLSMHSGIEYYELTHGSLTIFVLESLPYLWISLFILFVVLAYINLRHTKRGYRYPFWQIIISSLVFTLLIGFGLHFAGVNKTIDRMIDNMPMPYQSPEERQAYLWAHPEDGRITGVFVRHSENSMQVYFKDSVDREWLVDTKELMPADIKLLISGERVRLIGEANLNANPIFFYSCTVLPWMRGEGDSFKTIKENREEMKRHLKQFGVGKPIDNNSPLRCREILGRLGTN